MYLRLNHEMASIAHKLGKDNMLSVVFLQWLFDFFVINFNDASHPPATMSGSTPCGPSSRRPSPGLQTSSGTLFLQSELRHAMKKEIADQAFWFPSIKLSRTLSPKTPKPGVEAAGELLLLGDYDCTVDTQPFRDALNDVVARLKTFTPQPADAGQSASYHGLAQFLTGCVKACHDALEVQNVFPPRQDRWYKDLEFTVGKPVVDGVEGAASLMPKITGGNGISAFAEEQLYWNPPKDKPTHMITLPVEVGKHWGTMISQAATYARCLFSASPMRVFVLVLAFNHESNVLQFLVFHRGGLTASGEYDITKTDGLTEVARLFLTLTSWGTAKDAGVITCCSENIYLLPGDQEGTRYVRAATEATLSRFHCVRGRATRVSRLRLPTNALPMAPSERPPEMARGGPGLTTRSPSRDASALLEVQEQTNGWFFSCRQSRGKLTIRQMDTPEPTPTHSSSTFSPRRSFVRRTIRFCRS